MGLIGPMGLTPSLTHPPSDARHPDQSATFHGRDILAPVAGHLTLGVEPAKLGHRVDSWRRVILPQPTPTADGVRGEVVIVDRFGNLITNVRSGDFEPAGTMILAG